MVLNGEREGFGTMLRQARTARGLTLRELANRCRTNYTHLSRIETNAERVPSRQLLDRIVGAFEDPSAAALLAGAAGRLTPGAERAVSAYPRALAEPALSEQALPALRRIDVGVVVDGLLSRVPRRGLVGDRIEPEILCRSFGLRPVIKTGERGPAATFEGDAVVVRDPGEPGDAAALPRVRFLLAHAAAHAVLGVRACTFPRVGEAEQPAFDLAAHLLCPRQLLERALRAATLTLNDDERNPWASRSTAVVAVVAERLAVPGWVALRRLADEALLDDEAIYFSLGDQP
ncbi:helix-turn-helix domain-containing protein [Micromonospora profundi]|uniref:helix-turn-helix domain-containing protein n=1 Tax=Micromonospora profundi TaxID=1420889 RepID=UPI00365795E5